MRARSFTPRAQHSRSESLGSSLEVGCRHRRRVLGASEPILGLEMSDAYVRFPPFLVDHVAQRLLRDGEPVHLRPRTWNVLRYLVERAGQLVTKDDLLDSVWSDSIVSEGTLTNSIRELRAALGGDARSPTYIVTVHRRGFRFVAELAPAESPPALPATPSRPATTAQVAGTVAVVASAPAFVGRRPELDRL